MKKRFWAMLMLLCVLMSGCAKQESTVTVDCAEAGKAILAGQTFCGEMTEVTGDRLNRVLDLKENSWSQVYMSMDASRATAETVIVVTAKDSASLKDVESALTAYRDAVLEQYRTYQPLETPKIEAAKTVCYGLQCVLVIAPDQQQAQESCRKIWKK